jgi:HlyD family secretion protein
MKVRLSIILSIVLFCIIGYGLFVFAGNLLGVNGNYPGFIKVSGRIEGIEYHAAAKVPGKVIDLNVEEGQSVKAGEQIATINSPQLDAMIDQANSYLRKAESNLKLSEMEFERYSQLLEEKAVQKQFYDQVYGKYLAAKEDVLAAKKELQKLNDDLTDTKIVAPISGKVVTKIVQAGEVVGIGVPLISIINMDDLFLKVFLPTEIAGKISLGDEAKIFPDSSPEKSFDAFVNKIAEKAEFTPKNVETKSQRANMVFEVKLKVKDNRGYLLKPGMPAEALIRVDKNVDWQVHK